MGLEFRCVKGSSGGKAEEAGGAESNGLKLIFSSQAIQGY